MSNQKDSLWVGLTNPNGVSCTDSGCSKKLRWTDGEIFEWDNSLHSSLNVVPGTHAYSYSLTTKAFTGQTYTDVIEYSCMSECYCEYEVCTEFGKVRFQGCEKFTVNHAKVAYECHG